MEIVKNSIYVLTYDLGVLLYLYVTLHGFGYYLSSLLSRGCQTIESFLILPWYGTLFLSSILFLVNLFFPINWIVSLLCFLGGILGSILSLRSSKKQIKNGLKLLINKFSIIIFFILLLISLFTAIGHYLAYDLGLYHYQAVRLINSFPVIRGLVNIHSRLGNISSLYNITALVSFFPFGLRAPLFNLITVFYMFLFALYHCVLVIISIKKKEAHWTIFSLISILFFYFYWSKFIVTLDIVVLFFALQMGYHFCRFLLEKREEDFFHLSILALGAVTIKMSIAVLAFCFLCVVFLLRFQKLNSSKPFMRLVILMVTLFLPFLIHNILKTGMLLWPLAFTDLGLAWGNIPEAIENRTAVTGWARVPGAGYRESLESWNWLADWLKRHYKELLPLFSFFIGSLGFYITSLFYPKYIKNKRNNGQPLGIGTILFSFSPLLIALLYWFFVLPDFRFSHGLFFLPTIILFTFGVKNLSNSGMFQHYFSLFPLQIIKIARFPLYLAFFTLVPFWLILLLPDMAKAVFRLRLEPLPVVNMIKEVNQYGLEYYHPKKGDQAWDTTLFPNTPYRLDHVELIGGDIRDGFMLATENEKKTE